MKFEVDCIEHLSDSLEKGSREVAVSIDHPYCLKAFLDYRSSRAAGF